MSTRVFVPCLAILLLAFAPVGPDASLLSPLAACAEIAQADRTRGPLAVAAQQQADRLGRLASDDDALAFYRSDLARALAIEDTTPLLEATETRRLRPGTVPPPVLKDPALHLVKALARWSTARVLREAADGGEIPKLAALEQRERARWQWLLNGMEAQPLGRALRIAAVITAVEETPASVPTVTSGYPDLAAYLDRTYPDLATGPGSWVGVAEREGTAGVRQRMLGHWQHEGRGDASEEAMQMYFHRRLRPVFLAQVTASALLAEADAERQAGERWRQLQSWREDWSTARGRARLCGTWAWTVHNHQNHQDHKMVVTFPPPDLTPSGPAVPKTIVVLADSVYLRWEFPGGYQEDSLLFSGKDQRLEGTFVNSRGPYGAITGRKVQPCSAER